MLAAFADSPDFILRVAEFLYFANKGWRKLDSWLTASQFFCLLFVVISRRYTMSLEIYKIVLNPHSESYANFLALSQTSTSSREVYIPLVTSPSTFLFL